MKFRNVLLFVAAATVVLAGHAAAQNAQADANKGAQPTAEQAAKAEEAARKKAAEERARAEKAKADAAKSRTGDANEEEEEDT